MRGSAKSRGLTLGVAAGLVAGAALLLGQGTAAQGDDATSITVGVYDPQAVFDSSGHMQELMNSMNQLQGEMQEAQQTGDQQALMEIQQRAQTQQQQATDAFEAKLDEVLPEVAEETGAALVAIEVSYKAPGIQERDITQELAERIGPAEPAREALPQEAPAQPAPPPGAPPAQPF